ncbi:EpsG family protein [Ralstonia sp. 24A2]|uniref:EpsG family protein n=1 Tax=Ralstonia sp. 24A2 TaxID=3447364 RepID=UPI003F699602
MQQQNRTSSTLRPSRGPLPHALYIVAGMLLALLFAAADFGPDSDKTAYALYFDAIAHNLGIPTGFERIEPGFYGFTWLVTHITESTYAYFWLIFTFQFFGLTSTWGKRSPLFRDGVYSALLWLAFPMFYSLSLNVLRQGMALVFVIYALDAELTGRRYRPFALICLGTLFHASTLIFAPALLILRLNWSLRTFLLIWSLCVVAAVASLPQQLVALVASVIPPGISEQYPYYFSYLTGELAETYNTGLKWHFIAFSALPILAWVVARQCRFAVDRNCLRVIKLYLLLNGLFFFIGHIPFSDRIALLSWQLMPIIGLGLTPQRIKPVMASVALLSAITLISYFSIL